MNIEITSQELKVMSKRQWSPTRYCYSFYLSIDEITPMLITGFGRTPDKAIRDAFSYRLMKKLQDYVAAKYDNHILSFKEV